ESGFEDWLREQRRTLGEIQGRLRKDTSALKLPARIVDVSQPPPGFGGRPALAVLQFRNLTGEIDNDYLAEGIAEELIERLSRLRWLPVIGRSSSFSVAAGTLTQRQIGNALCSRYLLEGRLRQLRDAFVLSIVLTEAETGYVLWSTRFNLPAQFGSEAMERL